MPPATVTQILEPHTTSSEFVEWNLKENEKNKEFDTTTDEQKEERSVYDISLSTLPQPWFLKPVRKWEKEYGFVTPIRWVNTVLISTFNIVFLYYIMSFLFLDLGMKSFQTAVFAYLMGQVAGFGVTAGVHRHWTHRSYKARWPLKIILLICYSVAGQNTIFEWVRDHRVHHKFSETSADPHDANRGFYFSHIGWLMMKKHPDVIREGRKMDMDDINNDPFVQFHTKYFLVFKVLCCWLIPTLIPWLCWGETMEVSFITQCIFRYNLSLHFTWSVNSFAHLWGNKPYDIHIMPSENRGVSIVAMGEGWHNYHHTFPWDYKAAELGVTNNVTTTIINYFAKIGWAYDLKQASPALVRAVRKSRGESLEDS